MVLAQIGNRPEIDPHIYAWYLTKATQLSEGKKLISLPGQVGVHMEKYSWFPTQRIHGKSVLDTEIYKYKTQTVEYLENTTECFYDFKVGKDFLWEQKV